MNQQTLFAHQATPATLDRGGFELGWDHARHGLVPPAGLVLDSTALGQGWRAGKVVMGRRTEVAPRALRQWLGLRTSAWREGIAFETTRLTATALAQLDVTHCPLLRCCLGGAPGEASAPAYLRIDPSGSYAVGNVAQVSSAAAVACRGVGVHEALRRARRAQLGGEPVADLDAAVWWRIAAMRSFATPLPFAEAARLPLALLPPNQARVVNPVQSLQVLVTSHCLQPGWASRLRGFATLLTGDALRQDFNLLVGALAPHAVLPAPSPRAMRLVMEDAWLTERVQRRWRQFVLALGEPGCLGLLQRAGAMPPTSSARRS